MDMGTPLSFPSASGWGVLCKVGEEENCEEIVDWQSNLLSGVVGALGVQLLSMLWGEIKRRREYHALLKGIIAECDYNLSIVDEILEGAVNQSGSFKRMSVEFFRSAREGAVKYSMSQELIRALSRAVVDLDLYNLEADYIFNGSESHAVYTGNIGDGLVQVERKTVGLNIKPTMIAARQGVADTLNCLKELAEKTRKGENE